MISSTKIRVMLSFIFLMLIGCSVKQKHIIEMNDVHSFQLLEISMDSSGDDLELMERIRSNEYETGASFEFDDETSLNLLNKLLKEMTSSSSDAFILIGGWEVIELSLSTQNVKDRYLLFYHYGDSYSAHLIVMDLDSRESTKYTISDALWEETVVILLGDDWSLLK